MLSATCASRGRPVGGGGEIAFAWLVTLPVWIGAGYFVFGALDFALPGNGATRAWAGTVESPMIAGLA